MPPLILTNSQTQELPISTILDSGPVSYIIDGTGPDGSPVAKNGQGGRNDDLLTSVKRRMVSHTVAITNDPATGNDFPLMRPASLNSFSIRDSNGRPPERLQQPANQPTFLNQDLIDQEAVNRLTNRNLTERVPRISLENIHRGRSSAPGINGNQLLSQNQSQLLLNVAPKVSSVLKHNRFNEEKTYLSLFENGDDDNVALAGYQPDQGKYVAHETNENPEITLKDLKKVGFIMLMEACGKPEFLSRDLESGANKEAMRLTPGQAEIGIPIDFDQMAATEALHKIKEKYKKKANSNRFFTNARSVKSYGSVNNQENHFSGLSSYGSIILAGAMITTLKGLVTGISLIMDLVVKTKPGGDFISGVSGLINPPSTTRHGVSDATENFGSNFFTYVNKGLDIFFAWDGRSYMRVVLNPGYYLTLVRSIVRSEAVAILKFTKLDSLTDALLAVEDLANSKLFSFMRVMAQIGQVNEFWEQSQASSRGTAYYVDTDNTPAMMNIPGATSDSTRLENPFAHVVKSRIDNKTAWRNDATASAYLFPESIIDASRKYHNADFTFGSAINRHTKLTGSSTRISQEDRKKIEQILDAEYVPFYFHDLRTNEIISFHAFLESMTDNYQAEYESSSGYGRGGKVSIYKNTNRTIGMSFSAVATSENDFDLMYLKINKLLTMVYPQWTEGRTVKIGTRKFTQPFSQTPGASPLIRLRLGDVFKSNYSKFSAARLFGLGDRSFTMNTNSQQVAARSTLDEEKQQARTRLREETYIFENSEEVTINGGAVRTIYHSEGNNFVPSAGALSRANLAVVVTGRIVGSVVDRSGTLLYIVDAQIPANSIGANSRSRGRASRSRAPSPTAVPSTTDGRSVLIGVPLQDLTLSAAEIERKINRQFASQEATSGDPSISQERQGIQEFFSNDNPVIRSFASTEGKGLAGFITSINFNWKDGPWETTRFNSIAPQMCKIEFNFEPVFDIAPGLDHNGFNRAPVYNIGEAMENLSKDNEEDPGKEMFNKSRLALTRGSRGR